MKTSAALQAKDRRINPDDKKMIGSYFPDQFPNIPGGLRLWRQVINRSYTVFKIIPFVHPDRWKVFGFSIINTSANNVKPVLLTHLPAHIGYGLNGPSRFVSRKKVLVKNQDLFHGFEIKCGQAACTSLRTMNLLMSGKIK
jgi:hypothetical protein